MAIFLPWQTMAPGNGKATFHDPVRDRAEAALGIVLVGSPGPRRLRTFARGARSGCRRRSRDHHTDLPHGVRRDLDWLLQSPSARHIASGRGPDQARAPDRIRLPVVGGLMLLDHAASGVAEPDVATGRLRKRPWNSCTAVSEVGHWPASSITSHTRSRRPVRG
jgi:hypothetical protein